MIQLMAVGKDCRVIAFLTAHTAIFFHIFNCYCAYKQGCAALLCGGFIEGQ
jgi:hypothetical protein